MWTVEPLHFDATLTPASQDAGVTAPAQLLSISSVKNVDFLLSLNSITPENLYFKLNNFTIIIIS